MNEPKLEIVEVTDDRPIKTLLGAIAHAVSGDLVVCSGPKTLPIAIIPAAWLPALRKYLNEGNNDYDRIYKLGYVQGSSDKEFELNEGMVEKWVVIRDESGQIYFCSSRRKAETRVKAEQRGRVACILVPAKEGDQ